MSAGDDGRSTTALQATHASGCIPNDMPGPSGVCCGDGTGTGCAPNYECQSSVVERDDGVESETRLFCKRGSEAKNDPLVETMPRYTLCSPPPGTLAHVHGLPMDRSGSGPKQRGGRPEEATPAALAYYSTHGDILGSGTDKSSIQVAIVVIHGMGRNADDYYCSGTAAASMQTYYDTSSVIIISPRFLDPSDGEVRLTSEYIPMRWGGDGDKFGAWRYGADASFPSSASGTSSFDAIDHLIDVLGDRDRFPRLERISVAGHSSGGQFVQRWALLSACNLWDGSRYHAATRGIAGPPSLPKLRAIVGNPSSYAYLDGRRFVNGKFQVPTSAFISSCPSYNQWEWGLDPGGTMVTPYKDRAIEDAGGVANVAKRFAIRDVVYLSGGQDRCNVTGLDRTGFCYSHGLEAACGDMMEGKQRLERGDNYYQSLKEYYGRYVHARMVVEGVGHDHSLMWESSVGLSALFDDLFYNNAESNEASMS